MEKSNNKTKSCRTFRSAAIIAAAGVLLVMLVSTGCKKTTKVKFQVDNSFQPFIFQTTYPDSTFKGDSIRQNDYTLELEYDHPLKNYCCYVGNRGCVNSNIHVRIYVDGVLKSEQDSIYCGGNFCIH